MRYLRLKMADLFFLQIQPYRANLGCLEPVNVGDNSVPETSSGHECVRNKFSVLCCPV